MTQSTTHYRVAPASRVHRPVAPYAPKGPAAILVAHGMGQQVPFQTLDAVAEGLLQQDRLRRGGPLGRGARMGPQTDPVARTVMVGQERLQRLELKLLDRDGSERAVHLYEAYWAPLTQGRVTLRDVFAFLVRAALFGILAAKHPYRRWLFGRDSEFPAPIRTVMYLVVALAVVLSLGALNAIILAFTAARAPLHTPPAWLGDALFADVTTILNVLVTVLVVFAATLAWSMQARRKGGRLPGWPSVVTFGLAVWTTIAAAIAAVVVIAYHARPEQAGASLFERAGLGPAAQSFDRVFDAGAAALLAAAVAWLLFRAVVALHLGVRSDLTYNPKTRPMTRQVRNWFVLLAISLLALAAALVWSSGGAPATWRHGLAWPLVIVASAIVRWFLIEFAGDVAAYVQPQVVDRFAELRHQIKECVWRTAHAVYSMPEYEDVVLVGHSLGSVVLYDVLNRMILDRELGGASAPDVVPRTRLLLTFGSPLDKTAFFFALQGPDSVAATARRALAASVQPLITQDAVRPPWVNVYSPWDIISGSLDYYDRPDRSNRRPVENVRDNNATTLLGAHVEYWNSPVVFSTIVEHLL